MATIGRPADLADPYARLGLVPGAALDDVKRAYRRLAMDVHPDHAGPASVPTFVALKAAYEWIVAHRSFGEPGDRRPGAVPRTTDARPARTVPPRPSSAAPAAAPVAPMAPVGGSWPGGRWYWEGLYARASRR
jgi:hypothetical protein